MKNACEVTRLEVDRGPNWLFVKVIPGKSKEALEDLGDDLWAVVAKHFVYRLVVELDEFDALPENVINQLAELQHRLEEHDGALRVCGLQKRCVEKLQRAQRAWAMPSHSTRAAAVLGPAHTHDLLPASHFEGVVTSSTCDEVALTR